MNFIDIEQLLEIHTLLIDRYGGKLGIRDVGRLQAALAVQSQQIFGMELYPSVHDKAAAMMRGIIADHPFVDGNKRTGMLVTLTYLEINECTFLANRGEIEDFAVSVATDTLSVEQIATWLRVHTQ